MPKQKTKKIVAKRFKITATGKILHGKQSGRHRKSHKSRSQRRRQIGMKELNPTQSSLIKKFLSL